MSLYKLFSVIFFSSVVLSCVYDIDDKLNLAKSLESHEIITLDSELFNQIKTIVNDDANEPHKTLACIDFIYPLTIFVANENYDIISTTSVNSDQEFSDLIGSLSFEYAISISFPITSILESGETFTVNNKEELKDAIDQCQDIEIVQECGDLISNCLWKIGYYYDSENVYMSGIFQESGGFTSLLFDNNYLSGSWSPLVIEHELYLNISLNETTEIGLYFSKNWKAEYIDGNSLKLTHENETLILNQRCDTDFDLCGNFDFEKCIGQDTNFAEFILNDYTFCIFDSMELNEDFDISYHQSEEEAISSTNPIDPNLAYAISENVQIIFVRINDVENDLQYYARITLILTDC